MLPLLIETLVKIALLMGGLMGAAAYLVLVERWVAAWMQDRLGPNRVGIPLTKIRLFGLGQPVADGAKIFLKENILPGHVDGVLYRLAPVIIFTAALAVYAVVPFGSMLLPLPEVLGGPRIVPLVVAPTLDVGAIYVFAVGSIAVYGVLLGGWSSDTKYSFFGSVRAAAQLISYELPLGLGILGVVLAAGSLRLDTIITQQAQAGAWNAFLQPLGMLVLLVAGFAEAGRLPFDIYEAEQELVGGYHTEYSGARLMMFLTAEYLHMVTVAFVFSVFFLGGWHFWGLTGSAEVASWPVALLRVAVLLAKAGAVILFFMLARWSWARFRFDQLMALAWQVMLPLGLVNLVMVAVWREYGHGLAAQLGISSMLLMAAVGWTTLAVALIIVVMAAPETGDNRPRRTPVMPAP